MKLIFLFTILFLTFGANAKEGTSVLRKIEWKLISNKEGIKVFIPREYAHDSGLIPIRFTTTLNYNVSKVLTVLADNKRKLEWIPRGKEVSMLERKSLSDFTVYYKYDLPWPLKDRDFIIRNMGRFDKKTMKISVDLLSVAHPKDPASGKDDAVRGKVYDGYTIIEPTGDKETKVEMALLNEFNGLIPTWVINMIQKKWPYRFMKNLKVQLAKDDIKINPDFKFTSKKNAR